MYIHTHTKIYPILIQLIVKIYNLIAGVIGKDYNIITHLQLELLKMKKQAPQNERLQ